MSQVLLEITNDTIKEKVLWMLEHFKDDGVKVKLLESNQEIDYTDEYIKKNWKALLSKGLSHYNEDYYKSEQYKLDRGEYLMEKYKK